MVDFGYRWVVIRDEQVEEEPGCWLDHGYHRRCDFSLMLVVHRLL